jgi:flagellin-specific chaperone FliS
VQNAGKNISEAKKIDEKNKDIDKMMLIFTTIPTPIELSLKCNSEDDIKNQLKEIYKNNEKNA